jgi:hypothetical protein
MDRAMMRLNVEAEIVQLIRNYSWIKQRNNASTIGSCEHTRVTEKGTMAERHARGRMVAEADG